MKTRQYYESREQFEKLNPYVEIEAPRYDGKKCGFAQIISNFTSKKQADAKAYGLVMTRKQAEKFVRQWNEEYEQGNMSLAIFQK